jgi:hypothetical protein
VLAGEHLLGSYARLALQKFLGVRGAQTFMAHGVTAC